jgi:hypothetical protein
MRRVVLPPVPVADARECGGAVLYPPRAFPVRPGDID